MCIRDRPTRARSRGRRGGGRSRRARSPRSTEETNERAKRLVEPVDRTDRTDRTIRTVGPNGPNGPNGTLARYRRASGDFRRARKRRRRRFTWYVNCLKRARGDRRIVRHSAFRRAGESAFRRARVGFHTPRRPTTRFHALLAPDLYVGLPPSPRARRATSRDGRPSPECVLCEKTRCWRSETSSAGDSSPTLAPRRTRRGGWRRPPFAP